MKKAIVVLALSVLVVSSVSHAVLFTDDFESGTLDQWTIEGQQAGRESTAEIINKNGSQMGHLYQDGSSWIFLSKTFDYQSDLNFSIHMETSVYSEAPDPEGNLYASAGIGFSFLDAASNELGHFKYIDTTSTWPLDDTSSVPNRHLIPIDGSLESYSLDVQDILSYITIDMDELAAIKMFFGVYASSDAYNMSANVWMNNVVVTPEPATMLLLGLGGLMLRKGKK